MATVASADDLFSSKIEPVLREHCFACHSHAAGKMKGGLTLDARSGWAAGGDSGPAITPGRPSESLLLSALRHETFEMPPDSKLPEEVIADFEQWIALGADDPRTLDLHDNPGNWWSLLPLTRNLPPAIAAQQLHERHATEQHATEQHATEQHATERHLTEQRVALDSHGHQAGERSSVHPIDRFIDHRLIAQGLRRSPEADATTLIRRLTIDLHGLQPTPEDVAAFVADNRSDAYERLVERLLASPRYGERWARHWMDTIHFADSHGFEHDVGREHAWPFRDYLVDALNQDKAWAQFTREQLAADYFCPDQPELTAALGFLGAGNFDLSTFSTAPVTFDYMDRDDLVTQTVGAFLSTTASCARCHDHKFDPIPQADYYALQAVFSGVLKGDILYDRSPDVHRERQRWKALLAAAKNRDPDVLLTPEHAERIEGWLATQSARVGWEPLRFDTYLSTAGATLTRQPEGYLLASGTLPDMDTTVVAGVTALKTITALRLDVLPHDSLPMRGPGRCENGNLHLSEVDVQIFEPQATTGRRLTLSRASADFDQEGWGISRAIDGDPATAWGIHPRVGEPHHAVFEFAEPVQVAPESRLLVSLKQLHGRAHLLGAFHLSVTDSPVVEVVALPQEVDAALAVESHTRSQEQRLAIAAYVLSQAADAQLSQLPKMDRVYAAGPTVEVPGGEGAYTTHSIAAPKPVHLLRRGDFDKPELEVPPGALSMLEHAAERFAAAGSSGATALSDAARRAALAEWIVHPNNALTWRSAVNRVWSFHFGRGLCNTPNDFGRMGDTPSHPELIDWLAVWFRDDAQGSLKQLHRLMVTSGTYRQSTRFDAEANAIDSDNRGLWRQQRWRLDADTFRDAVLGCSGAVDLTMGGPAVEHFAKSKGPQSTPVLTYENYDWGQAAAARRSIYRCVWRGIADPFMEALDFPDLGLLAPQRSYSTSALQALSLYNHDFVLHHSAELARRVERERPTGVDAQVQRMVELVWLRNPNEDEARLLNDFAAQHGLAAVARLLFNSNEFLFVE